MPRILRLPEVCRLVGLSRSSVLRLERAGKFAKKFNICGLHAIGFDEAEVMAWIQSRRAGSLATNGDAARRP